MGTACGNWLVLYLHLPWKDDHHTVPFGVCASWGVGALTPFLYGCMWNLSIICLAAGFITGQIQKYQPEMMACRHGLDWQEKPMGVMWHSLGIHLGRIWVCWEQQKEEGSALLMQGSVKWHTGFYFLGLGIAVLHFLWLFLRIRWPDALLWRLRGNGLLQATWLVYGRGKFKLGKSWFTAQAISNYTTPAPVRVYNCCPHY